MSISFGSAPGNLMNRLGSLGGLVKNLKSYQTTQLSAMTDTTTGVVAEYNSESDIQAVMGGAYIGVLSATDSVIGSLVQNMAALTVNRMVFRDNPQLNQTLIGSNTLSSIYEVIRQMKLAGASVLAMQVAATPQAFVGVGTGVVNASVKRPFDGLVLENAYAENLLFYCVADSYTGSAVAGNEQFQVTGTGNESDVFAFDWPLGSNCQLSVSAIDGNADNGSGNLLTNSGFTNWTASVPDHFSLTQGVAGTNIYQETTIVLDSSASSLAVVGDAGGTNTTLRQKFNDGTLGTSGSLQALTQYSFNLFARRDGTVPGAGVLTVSLVDSGGVVVRDQAGVANSFTINLTLLSTVFGSFTGVFRTPEVMPGSVYLQLQLSTPLTSGRTIYLDRMSLGLMTQCYVSGPFVAVHSGGTNFTFADYSYLGISNGRGAGGTLSTWQTFLQQCFPQVLSNEILFPSSLTPTISDNLLI